MEYKVDSSEGRLGYVVFIPHLAVKRCSHWRLAKLC